MRVLTRVFVLVGGLCVWGCGGPAGSCRIAASGGMGEKCIDFTQGYSSDAAKETCALAASATYSAMECPSTNRVGRCTQSRPDGDFTQVLNSYGPTTAAQAMMTCTSAGGTFTAN